MPEPLVFKDLMHNDWSKFQFSFFREGVEICPLYSGETTWALLRYQPGARVPRHHHPGLETILVLEGSQSDERGEYQKGTCVLNPPGYQHSVYSEKGCIVLVQWLKPVEFCE